jgi:hypothetical protein
MYDRIEEHEQDGDATENASGPELTLRDGSGLRGIFH